jgi:hypothetical protein
MIFQPVKANGTHYAHDLNVWAQYGREERQIRRGWRSPVGRSGRRLQRNIEQRKKESAALTEPTMDSKSVKPMPELQFDFVKQCASELSVVDLE